LSRGLVISSVGHTVNPITILNEKETEMATLYVTETGVQVHKQGQRLIVKRGPEVLQDIPMIKVDRVVVIGKGVNISTPTLITLTRRRVPVNFTCGMTVLGREHRHSRLRMLQALAVNDSARAMAIAQAIVSGKVNNQRVLVQRHAGGATGARNALATMDHMRRQVDSAQNLDELRGREGMAAKEYFHLLRLILRPPSDGRSWGFERRAYYPPTDPINALLSFGYTLLLNDLVAACQISGLDPDLGFFHAIDYNKPAMALDLEEEFRPIIVDSIVLAAANRPLFNLSDFEVGHPSQPNDEDEDQDVPHLSLPFPKDGRWDGGEGVRPIYLKETSRVRFINLYEARINEQILYPATGEQTSYRRIFELQAYRLVRVILGEVKDYVPFMVR